MACSKAFVGLLLLCQLPGCMHVSKYQMRDLVEPVLDRRAFEGTYEDGGVLFGRPISLWHWLADDQSKESDAPGVLTTRIECVSERGFVAIWLRDGRELKRVALPFAWTGGYLLGLGESTSYAYVSGRNQPLAQKIYDRVAWK